MSPPTSYFLLAAGAFVAGLIDAIVGGGGLITVPLFMLVLGPGPLAIGSNKVAAVFSQAAAAFIYWRHKSDRASKPMDAEARTLLFRSLFLTALGSALGALASPQFPPWFFRWMMIVIAPVILILVLSRGLWTRTQSHKRHPVRALIATTASGFYDGVAGPGGGTLMFMSLFVIGGYSAELAITDGKFANLASALTSLCFYALQGQVNWSLGLVAGVPIALGSWIGAQVASRRIKGPSTGNDPSTTIARFALVIVSILLVVRFLLASF